MRFLKRVLAVIALFWYTVWRTEVIRPVKPKCSLGEMTTMGANIRAKIALSPAASDVETRKISVNVNGSDAPELAQSIAGDATEFEVVTVHGSAVVVTVIDVNEDGVEGDPATLSYSALDGVKPPAPTLTLAGSAPDA